MRLIDRTVWNQYCNYENGKSFALHVAAKERYLLGAAFNIHCQCCSSRTRCFMEAFLVFIYVQFSFDNRLTSCMLPATIDQNFLARKISVALGTIAHMANIFRAIEVIRYHEVISNMNWSCRIFRIDEATRNVLFKERDSMWSYGIDKWKICKHVRELGITLYSDSWLLGLNHGTYVAIGINFQTMI